MTSAQVTFERLMVTGDLAPDGVPFTGFQPPLVSSAGHLLVHAQADHGAGIERRAYVRDPSGAVREVLRPDMPIPMTANNIMTPSGALGGLLDRNGDVLFGFTLGFSVAFIVSGANTTLLGEHNESCPTNLDPTGHWSSIDMLRLTDTGRVIMHDVDCANAGIVAYEAGAYTAIAGMNGPAPGLAGTPTFTTIAYQQALQADSGHVWYIGVIACPDDPRCLNDNGTGLYVSTAQGLSSLIYLYGDPAPGVTDNALFGPTRLLSVNSGGTALVGVTLLDSSTRAPVGTALYTVTSGGVETLIARVGDGAPGLTGVTFSGLADPDFGLDAWIGDEGTVAFRSSLAGTGINSQNNSAIFRMPPTSTLSLVAQNGTTSPDGGIYDTFSMFLLSPGGRVALRARTFMGRVHDWLFLENDNGVLVPALESGAINDLGLGAPSAVTSFTTLGISTTGTDGRGRIFDGNGAIIAHIEHDGVQSIFSIRAGDPPTTVDLVAIEATQVVQDLHNSVSLIQGKPTFLRAYLQAADSTRVRVRLRGRRNGSELPGSPYEGRILGSLSLARPDILSERKTLGSAPYFEIPPAWASGTIEIEVELHPDSSNLRLDCHESAGPSSDDCKATLTFDPPGPALELQLFRFVHWRHTESQSVPRSEGRRLVDELRTFYPITKVRYRHRDFTVTSQDSDTIAGVYYNQLLEIAKEKEGCTFEAGCRAIYYGYYQPGFSPNFGGKADPEAGVAVGNAIFSGWYHYTQLHEIGHVLGRRHAVTTNHVFRNGIEYQEGHCSEVAVLGTDPWPYFEMLDGKTLATLSPLADVDGIMYGFDPNRWQVIDPRMHFELMSYCDQTRSTLDPFISGFTYGAIDDAIRARFPSSPPPAIQGPYSYVAAAGTLFANGAELAHLRSVTSERSAIAPPPAGEYALEARDRAGALLQTISFAPTFSESRPGVGEDGTPVASFQIFVPADPEPALLVLLKSGTEVTRMSASASSPTVSIIAPNGGENLAGDTISVAWTGADADGDELTYDVSVSINGGRSWQSVAADWLDESIALPATAIAGSTTALVRVDVSDGFNTGSDQSDAVFTTANRGPAPQIIRPSPGSLYIGNDAIILGGEAIDVEDGEIPGASLEWSSSVDGVLGTGESLMLLASTLSEGDHQLSLKATDSSGAFNAETISIRVRRAAPATLSDLSVSGAANPNPVAPAGTVALTFAITNEGPDDAPTTALIVRLPPGTSYRSATGPMGACINTGSEQQCELGPIAAFAAAEVSVEIRADVLGTQMIAASVPTRESDPNASNDRLELALLVDEAGSSGPLDGGVGVDATTGDARAGDAGVGGDAGSQPDSGIDGPDPDGSEGGCGCRATEPAEFGTWIALASLWLVLRRPRRRS